MKSYNFTIENNGEISKLFLENNCTDFMQAQQFIHQMQYGRNKNKSKLITIFSDNCGTCSTKHGVLKQLAIEQNKTEIQLMFGIFLMNKINTPSVGTILDIHHLSAIPEAHNYLRIHNQIIDCTKQGWTAKNFENDLLLELETLPHQICDWKINMHQQFIKIWLHAHQEIKLNADELWQIREECIIALSS